MARSECACRAWRPRWLGVADAEPAAKRAAEGHGVGGPLARRLDEGQGAGEAVAFRGGEIEGEAGIIRGGGENAVKAEDEALVVGQFLLRKQGRNVHIEAIARGIEKRRTSDLDHADQGKKHFVGGEFEPHCRAIIAWGPPETERPRRTQRGERIVSLE